MLFSPTKGFILVVLVKFRGTIWSNIVWNWIDCALISISKEACLRKTHISRMEKIARVENHTHFKSAAWSLFVHLFCPFNVENCLTLSIFKSIDSESPFLILTPWSIVMVLVFGLGIVVMEAPLKRMRPLFGQMSEGSQVSIVTISVEILKWQWLTYQG